MVLDIDTRNVINEWICITYDKYRLDNIREFIYMYP
jgi:hypothetical protein